MAGNGLSTGGLGATLIGIVLGAVICHFLFYLVPGLLGMGRDCRFTLSGLLRSVPWWFDHAWFSHGLAAVRLVGVNTLARPMLFPKDSMPRVSMFRSALSGLWERAFVGLKGIQYVAKVATYLPIIPFVVLLMGLAMFGGSRAVILRQQTQPLRWRVQGHVDYDRGYRWLLRHRRSGWG